MSNTTTQSPSFAEYFAAFVKRRAAKNALASINAKSIFDALDQTNITSVIVDFDGGGDSGQIEQITPYRGDEACDWPECNIHIQDLDMDGGDVLLTQDMREAIETLCYDILEDREGGWENNDGAFGTFSFDAATRKVTLDFNARYTTYETTEHCIEAGEV